MLKKNRIASMSSKASLMLGIIMLSSISMAYFTVGESGNLVKPGQYQIGMEPQFVFDNSGFNFSGFLDAPYGPDGSFRARMGVGDTNFEASLSYKWVPIPDYGNQPSVGGKVEATYARRSGGNWDAIRIIPLVSKNFETIYGPVTPYASLPLSLVGTPSNTQTALQLVGGCEYRPPDEPKWMFGAELGVSLNNAFTYISGNLTYIFDEKEISPKKKH